MKDIKNLPYIERPRERLLYFGSSELSNAELIAILFGKGSQKFPVMQIAENVITSIDNMPENILTKSVDRLCEIEGVGQGRAIILSAAIELGRRAFLGSGGPQRLPTSKHLADFLRPYFTNLDAPAYFLIMLNHQRELLAMQEIAFVHQDKPIKVDEVISAAHDAKAGEIVLCRRFKDLPDDLLEKEKAFFIQLDEATHMLRMQFSTLLVKY